MIRDVEITEDMIIRSKKRVKLMPKLSNSITHNTATLHGFVGEELVAKHFNADIVDTFHYDIVKCGYKLEVKTKRTTVTPQLDYDASLSRFNTTQQCHYYVFTRILNDLSAGWVMGMMPRGVYLLKSRFLKKGDRDGSNGFIVKSDCWNLRYDELFDCDETLFYEMC